MGSGRYMEVKRQLNAMYRSIGGVDAPIVETNWQHCAALHRLKRGFMTLNPYKAYEQDMHR